MSRKVEILSPAGSYESLQAAVKAGADAVYIGGTRFGARAFADNLQEDLLLKAIDFAHLHGCKIYLTVNTLLKECELQELYSYLLPYYRQGLDAVIVQDIGVLNFIREQFPNLPIHASTQMTITGVQGAKFLEDLGVQRVVTARELQLHEIQNIANETQLEIESFVHGALCYCYSGQCLFSSMIGGRSGNRGQCAQPCRLPYRAINGNNLYLMSLKDICTLEYIPELVEAGISSFKIEGRMKKPEYVALVTAMYRKYLDLYLQKGKKGYQVDPIDREKLMDLYNRGGFHGGYYYTRNGKDMISLHRPNHAGVPALKVVQSKGKSVTAKVLTVIHKGDVVEIANGAENYTFPNEIVCGKTIQFHTFKNQDIKNGQILHRTRNEALIQEIQEGILAKDIQKPMDGVLHLSLHEPMRLELCCQNTSIQVTGDYPVQALKQPMDEERIQKQMYKTGNTPFVFQNLEIQMEGELFVPLMALNELRRRGIEVLEQEILTSHRRADVDRIEPSQPPCDFKEHHFTVTASVEEIEQFRAVLESAIPARIYVDCNMVSHIWENEDISKLIAESHQKGKEIFLAMPHIFRKSAVDKFEAAYDRTINAGWDGILVRNYESFQFLKEHQYDKKIVTDYNLYQFNKAAKWFWRCRGVERTTAPLELNDRELQDVGLECSELVVYGHYPMMISAQCIKKTTDKCTHIRERIIIKDRFRKGFAVKNQCDYCYNIIYNSAPTILADQKEEILSLMPKAIRLQFTIEDYETTKKMLELYESTFFGGRDNVEIHTDFTRGHFKRGIK